MVPQIPIATDSLHKFTCMLGLALMLSGLLGFYGIYSITLDRKLALIEEINQLDLTEKRSALEDRRLDLKRRVLEVTKSNEDFYQGAVAGAFGAGLSLIAFGNWNWHKHGQKLDDKLKLLQVRKLEAEVVLLEASTAQGRAEAAATDDATVKPATSPPHSASN